MSHYFWVAHQELVYHICSFHLWMPTFPLKSQVCVPHLLSPKWFINSNDPVHPQVSCSNGIPTCVSIINLRHFLLLISLMLIYLLAHPDNLEKWEESCFLTLTPFIRNSNLEIEAASLCSDFLSRSEMFPSHWHFKQQSFL